MSLPQSFPFQKKFKNKNKNKKVEQDLFFFVMKAKHDGDMMWYGVKHIQRPQCWMDIPH